MNRIFWAALAALLVVGIGQADAATRAAPKDRAFRLGLSTDTKPTAGNAPGDLFYETDTDVTYIWIGAQDQGTSADWVQYGGGTSLSAMPNSSAYSGDLGSEYMNVRADCRVFTADGVIAANAGALVSVYAVELTANDDFIIYDNPSAASGTVILNATNLPAGFTSFPNYPAIFATGAFIDVTLTTGRVNVCYNN